MPRPLKPIGLHKLEGTYDSSRHAWRAHEPAAPGLLRDGNPPPWLTTAQKRLWRELVVQAPYGVLRNCDGPVFAAFIVQVDALARANRAQGSRALVDAEGKPSPYLRLARQSAETARLLAGELGFSPAARARLGTPLGAPPSEEPASEFKRFDLVLPSGERVAYAAPGKRRSAKLPS